MEGAHAIWTICTTHFDGQMLLLTMTFEITGHPLCDGGMLVQEGGAIELP